jgi:hypothetical protein
MIFVTGDRGFFATGDSGFFANGGTGFVQHINVNPK